MFPGAFIRRSVPYVHSLRGGGRGADRNEHQGSAARQWAGAGRGASAQRSSIFDIACNTGWLDPQDETKNLSWVRAFYRELAETGGVPVPGAAYDGGFINHPDTDLADPTWNTSGVPWHTMYYQENYPRLQQIKTRWDPRDVFRHALSIRPGRFL
jgi:aclacinomycin oxidase